MISYGKLWEVLDAKGIPKARLKLDGVVGGQSYTNLAAGKSMTMNTLNAICRYLNCQPGDLLEYVPDSPVDNPPKA